MYFARFRNGLAIVGVIGLSVCGGCGGGEQTYRVTGKVTFPDGKPLTGGQVEFRSLTKPLLIARADVEEDGSFQLSTFQSGDGALLGEHEVAVHPPLMMGDRDLNPNPPNIIDGKFEGYDTSGLKFTVTEEEVKNDFAIVVTKPTRPDPSQPKVSVEHGLNVSK